jgi:hypothetical protein
MPNRMLRDWTKSEKVNSLSVHAERFFVRLIMAVDDFGGFYADCRILRSSLFPLLDGVRDADLLRWMAECQKAGLIVVYENSGRRYLQILDFGQRLRQKHRKYPPPSDSDLLTVDSNVRADDGNMLTDDGLKRREEEEKGREEPPPDFSGYAGVVCFNAEETILASPIELEKIIARVGGFSVEEAKEILRKYHLHLESKEQYPMGRKAVFAGFEKWLMTEFKNKPLERTGIKGGMVF